MKLFRKIYVQAAVGMVLLSVWLLGWLLYETQKESLQDVIQYEAAQMDLQMQRFRDAVQTKKMTGESDSRVKESVLAYQFRSIFGSDGALFLDGEEQLEGSVPRWYDFWKVNLDAKKKISLQRSGHQFVEAAMKSARMLQRNLRKN